MNLIVCICLKKFFVKKFNFEKVGLQKTSLSRIIIMRFLSYQPQISGSTTLIPLASDYPVGRITDFQRKILSKDTSTIVYLGTMILHSNLISLITSQFFSFINYAHNINLPTNKMRLTYKQQIISQTFVSLFGQEHIEA